MSNTELIISERAANIGNFLVGRLLPFRQKRTVGPFAFIDHMGPTKMKSGENLDVAPHPHIGLSTLTYLFDGEIVHRDTLGSNVTIKPGAVNWMTAGKGVVHSERTPEEIRDKEKSLHGLQIWVALPKELEGMEPTFTHIEEKDLPSWEEQGVDFKLVAGEVFGKKSPVPVYSNLYFIEIKSDKDRMLNIGDALFGESALYILEGQVEADDYTYDERQILVAKDSKLCTFKIKAGSTVYIFGGEPFREERFIYWNFVSSDKNTIEEAKKNWREQNYEVFPKVPGDEEEYVPLPQKRKG